MARRGKSAAKKEAGPKPDRIQSEPLRPIRVVKRTLTRPDGTTCKVEVPVYPPFQLKQRSPARKPRRDW